MSNNERNEITLTVKESDPQLRPNTQVVQEQPKHS